MRRCSRQANCRQFTFSREVLLVKTGICVHAGEFIFQSVLAYQFCPEYLVYLYCNFFFLQFFLTRFLPLKALCFCLRHCFIWGVIQGLVLENFLTVLTGMHVLMQKFSNNVISDHICDSWLQQPKTECQVCMSWHTLHLPTFSLTVGKYYKWPLSWMSNPLPSSVTMWLSGKRFLLLLSSLLPLKRGHVGVMACTVCAVGN